MFKKTIKYIIPAIFIAGIFIYLFRVSILEGVGNYLIDVDEPEQVEACFVLGGNSIDRGAKAYELYELEFCEKIVCLGGNKSTLLESMGVDKTEAELSGEHIIKNLGAKRRDVVLLQQGTSTMEESDLILDYAKDAGLKKIIVVSDLFHTHRIRGVFEDKFEAAGIQVLLVGTPSSLYDEDNWWKSEEGLIMLNNEYVKTFYYWLKY